MSATLLGTAVPLHEAFDAALVDLDGVTYRGPGVVPEAPAALSAARDAGMSLVYVTNNASRTSRDVAAHLTSVGIPATPDQVFTAAQAAAAILADRFGAAGARILVVGGEGLREAVGAVGMTIVESATDKPDAVVQGWSADVGWRQLAEASYAARDGAYFLATNLDPTLPNERGLAPGNGALVRVVATASGVEPESAGKPEPAMYVRAAQRVGAKRPLVVGDRLDTDLGGARAANFPGLLVLTGVSKALDALRAAPGVRPSYIGESIAALGEAHPTPASRGGWWHAGESAARIVGGTLEWEGRRGIDRLRAGCAAAWAAADDGEAAHIEEGVEDGIW
jgi:HAD superfamily hydrolase (TIGR01450 family)